MSWKPKSGVFDDLGNVHSLAQRMIVNTTRPECSRAALVGFYALCLCVWLYIFSTIRVCPAVFMKTCQVVCSFPSGTSYFAKTFLIRNPVNEQQGEYSLEQGTRQACVLSPLHACREDIEGLTFEYSSSLEVIVA